MPTTPSSNSETAGPICGRSTKLLPLSEPQSEGHHDSKLGNRSPLVKTPTRARRRERVRRAQRHHRERKEKYVKVLEKALSGLQEEEMSILNGCLEAKEENEILRDIMLANGIPLPERIRRKNAYTASVSVSGEPGKGQRLVVHMPPSDSQGPHYHGMGQGRDPGQTSSRKSSQKPHPHGLDSTQVGVDFVLSLEHPCLEHTRPAPGSEDPSGHALTCQAPLLAFAPSVIHSNSKWEIPAIELDRLFEFALALDLEGEVTAIQAWNRIRNHPEFHTLDHERLDELCSALLEEVECFGFGATIEEETFNDLLNQTFYPNS